MSNIILKGVGANKVEVIKTLREVTGLGLRESKGIVDGVESGNVYTITDIQETDVQAVIQKFLQIGASVDAEGITKEDMQESSEESEDLNKEPKQMSMSAETTAAEAAEDLNKEPKQTMISKALDKFIEWHEKSLERSKIPTIILIVIEVAFALWLLYKAWEVIFGIAIIVIIVRPFIAKQGFTDEDRRNSIEIVKEFAKIIVFVIISIVIVLNWSSISSIWRPAAVVRDAYFTNYSDEITIGEAFENVFTDCEWSKYTYNGNKYVRFTGKFIDDTGTAATYQFNFLVLGDSATIDSIYINGIDVSGMETALLVGIYNRNGVSW